MSLHHTWEQDCFCCSQVMFYWGNIHGKSYPAAWGVSAAFSKVWGVGCCVCLGGELPLLWFPLPLLKCVSLTVKNPSKWLSFYSAPCKKKIDQHGIARNHDSKISNFCLFSPEILESYIFSLSQKLLSGTHKLMQKGVHLLKFPRFQNCSLRTELAKYERSS